jgi:hypothetical protein
LTGRTTQRARAIGVGLALAALAAAGNAAAASPAAWPPTNQGLWPLGILQKENLAKPHPKPSFDLTGTWTLKIEPATGGFNFLPLPKLKPEAQALYDAGQKANAEGKAFRDDTGACWPAGMPKWWTRVWPIQFMQYPTGIIAVQGLFNAGRWIYLDGRGHVDPEIGEPTYNGDSIGRWEGDTLVVDTTNFQSKRHWVMQGVPISDQFHIVERIKMAKDGQGRPVLHRRTDHDRPGQLGRGVEEHQDHGPGEGRRRGRKPLSARPQRSDRRHPLRA